MGIHSAKKHPKLNGTECKVAFGFLEDFRRLLYKLDYYVITVSPFSLWLSGHNQHIVLRLVPVLLGACTQNIGPIPFNDLSL